MESVIKILREKNRYTQVHLAEELGIWSSPKSCVKSNPNIMICN